MTDDVTAGVTAGVTAALSGAGRPTGTTGARRRAEILDAAVSVFADSGFRGGTLRDIAARVGLSQAGVLHYFATKDALLEATLRRRDDLALERMTADLPTAEPPTGLALLEAFVSLVADNTTTPGLVALYAVLSGEGTAPDHPGNAYFRTRYALVRTLLEDAVRVGQVRDELRPDVDPVVVARTVIALSDGLQIQWLYEDGGFDMTGPVTAYVESLRPGAAAYREHLEPKETSTR
jgi:AcrR family transcriptional regulator